MNLTAELDYQLEKISHKPRLDKGPKEILSLLDLTLLDQKANKDMVWQLANTAMEVQAAAICIYPEQLSWISKDNPIKKASVLNFPTGALPLEQVLANLSEIINQNLVDEIDYVFPYQDYLQGHTEKALKACLRSYEVCRDNQLIFKVILETGAFPTPELIYQAARDIIQQGCDFLKTSTGKISQGASVPAAYALLKAIKDEATKPCGIKLSGGIRTQQQSMQYIKLSEYVLEKKVDASWFRIGASSVACAG